MAEIVLSRIVLQEIKIYAKDPRRCHPDCQFCEKDDGQYQCLLYRECVDNGDFEDEGEMYGFKRADKCVKYFGTGGQNERVRKAD